MKTAVIGFGNAGGKIADEIIQYEVESGRSVCRSIHAINTATTDLARLKFVPQDNHVLIGQADERVKGHGVGADPDLGTEVAAADRQELERELDNIPIYDIDAFLVIAGLGGGTGSGGAPVLVSALKEMYAEPVYGLGILPGQDEGGRASLNAARTLPTFTEATDNLLLFDNAAWRHGGDSIERGYSRTNEEIAKRVVTLLSAGEVDAPTVSENAMDSSDIRRTLDTGGVSTIAFSENEIEESTRNNRGLLNRFRTGPAAVADGAGLATKTHGLVRQAVHSRLTCPADIGSAERSLLVVSGPPEELSLKGLERSRQWLERETGSVEVLAGDDPREGADSLAAVVLLSNVTEVPRVNRLQEQAVAAQDNIREQEANRERDIENLITDDDNRLDPI